MAQERVLVVEDEPGVLEMTLQVLEAMPERFQLSGVRTAKEAIDRLDRDRPHVVLLDLNLGRRFDGLDICRTIRENPRLRHTAVIVLTGELMDAAESMLLDAGADDYVSKAHFTPRLLESRLRAVLRRTLKEETRKITHGPLQLDPARREAVVDDRDIRLTPTEFDLLYKLASTPDKALTRRELLDRGSGASAIERTVDVHVLSIRRKLGRHDGLVETVFGVGYRVGTSKASPAS